MAQTHEKRKDIHPFFKKPSGMAEPPVTSSDGFLLATINASQTFFPASEVLTPSNPSVEVSDNFREGVNGTAGSEDDLVPGPDLLEVDLNHGRRKRRKTASPNNKIAQETTPIGKGIELHSPTCYHDNDDLKFGKPATHLDGGSGSTPQTPGAVLLQDHSPSQPNEYDTTYVVNVKPAVGDVELDICQSKTEIPKTTEFGQSSIAIDAGLGEIQDQPTIPNSQKSSQKEKKLLRLNPKTGTIGSPPAKRVARSINSGSGKVISGSSKAPKSLIVKMTYHHSKGTTPEFGRKVDQILSNTKETHSPPKVCLNSEKETAKGDAPKSTHPFFLGKAALKSSATVRTTNVPLLPSSTAEPPVTTSAVQRPPSLVSRLGSTKVSAFQNFGSGGKLMKFPGTVEPIWPPSDMLHVRCLSKDEIVGESKSKTLPPSTSKKSKYAAPETSAEEDILDRIANKLNIAKVVDVLRHVDTDKFQEPDACLRLPVKHFESGLELQRRIRREISCPLLLSKPVCSSEDELQADSRDQRKVHPALVKLYDSISTSLTAFDQSTYESQSWVHKYAPTVAAEVLQRGRGPFILKEWLQSLTVVAVETGAESGRSRATSVASRRSATSKTDKAGKRKRKSKKLEGFVVSSDEEDDDMDEISEADSFSPRGSQGLLKKTVIRAGDANGKDSTKAMNAVLISGPHGCGKTAAVYAIAKELGFEVFEINSSSRRNGKDIMDRVGDMTQNHLVQSSLHLGACSAQDDDLQRVTDALEADLKSGRQGTMNSFFKPQPKLIPKLQEPSRGRKKRDLDNDAKSQAPAKSQTQQKQSLILFEEVDVLFEEDKQFWATVMTLLSISKRPIIMTCNDETVVPVQALSLHAIIRLAPPPVDLAVDYILLVAANEGHALQRKALKALYQAHRYDFRATLTELEFWCQIGVGDRRGGFDWFYPRLPIGIDKDTDGNTIRVVSEGTYKLGMGWLVRDFFQNQSGTIETELEIRQEALEVWQLDVSDIETDKCASVSPKQAEQVSSLSERAALDAYEEYLSTMSTVDMILGNQLADGNKLLLDTHAPALSSKVREDFILAYELLEADSLPCDNSISLNMSIWMKYQCHQLLHNTHKQPIKSTSNKSSELTEAHFLSMITETRVNPKVFLTRHNLSAAFDPIASVEPKYVWSSTSLEASAFDRPISLIVTEIAPYVRSILAYDAQLQQERARLSNLLSAGGKGGKRMRTTRSAMSALEGGKRNTTRRERWFGDGLNKELVMKTGQQSWLDAVPAMTANVEPTGIIAEVDTERAAPVDEASPADSVL